MEAIARALAARIAPGAALPGQLAAFPAGDKLPRAEAFVMESPLGHKFLRNAWRAAYAKGGKEYVLHLIVAEDTAGARRQLAAYLAFTGQPAALAAEGRVVALEDRFNGTVHALWRGNRLALLQNDSGAAVSPDAELAKLLPP
jgi:hypothetical protein